MDWREQVLALDDSELTRQVAERVMGWHESKPCDLWLDSDGKIVRWSVKGWKPLTDWNHCMMVVEAMLPNFDFDWNGHDSPEIGFIKGDNHYSVRAMRSSPQQLRKAILQAALIAVGAKQPTEQPT